MSSSGNEDFHSAPRPERRVGLLAPGEDHATHSDGSRAHSIHDIHEYDTVLRSADGDRSTGQHSPAESTSPPSRDVAHSRGRRMESLNELDEMNINELDAKVQAAKEAQERAAHTHEAVEVSEHSSSDNESSRPSPSSDEKPLPVRLRRSTLYHQNSDTLRTDHDDFLRHERDGDFVHKPSQFRVGGLGALQLLNHFASVSSSATSSPAQSRTSSPEREKSKSKRSKRNHSSSSLTNLFKSKKASKHIVRQHVSETHLRRRYILKLCNALMKYGAPTHRLEALMIATAHVLEVEAQFLYFPGVMVVSFDDRTTSTADVRMIRVAQGVDLGKMLETHHIYKWVLYNDIPVEEACELLDAVEGRPNKFRRNFLILVHGFASVTVGPWAFQAQWADLPIAFCFGLMLGWLRLVWAPKTEMWTNVFEIVAVILTSFLSRAFGSIGGDSTIFCFSNLAQSSIALILPGYIVLCAALELQSHAIIAGSIRMVYAFLYSLTIGFGLTVGTVIYGAIDSGATNTATCPHPMDKRWYILFMPAYAFCLCIINQAKWKQMPIMLIIAATSYVVSYFSGIKFSGNSEISSALAALCFSVMANIYGRLGKHWDRGQAIFFRWLKSLFVRTSSVEKNPPDLETQAQKQQHRSKITNIFRKIWSTVEYQDEKAVEEGPEPDTSETGSKKGFFAELKAVLLPSAQGRKRASHALASAVMLPAVFVLVPSGLSSQGSLVSSLQTSAQVNGNSTETTTTLTTQDIVSGRSNDSSTFTVGYSIIQIAIGLTVGTFFGSALVYPTAGQAGTLDRFSRSNSVLSEDDNQKQKRGNSRPESAST